MDYLSLGHRVERLHLETVLGSAMPATTLTLLDLPEPVDPATMTLTFADGAVWTATQDGPTFTFTATSTEVAAQGNGSSVRLVLDGIVLAVGEVVQR